MLCGEKHSQIEMGLLVSYEWDSTAHCLKGVQTRTPGSTAGGKL